MDNPQSHYNNIYKLIKISFDEQLVSDTPFCLLLCNPRTYKIALNYTLNYCKNHYISKLNIYVLHCIDFNLKGLEVNLEENTISKLKENIDIEVNTIFINDSSIDSILSTVCNDIKQIIYVFPILQLINYLKQIKNTILILFKKYSNSVEVIGLFVKFPFLNVELLKYIEGLPDDLP